MGCITSSDKSTSSSHPEDCCLQKRFWINRSKKMYKITHVPTTEEVVSCHKANLPVATRTTEILSICDDFHDGYDDEKSHGYFSESISTANTSDLSFNANDCDLKMEMYMMTKISQVMPKTSSPIMPTRNASRQMPPRNAIFEDEPSQSSYNRWRRHLQRTPPYVLNNVTQIPEAIAGQFSPEGFPAYTDIKRFQQRAAVATTQTQRRY